MRSTENDWRLDVVAYLDLFKFQICPWECVMLYLDCLSWFKCDELYQRCIVLYENIFHYYVNYILLIKKNVTEYKSGIIISWWTSGAGICLLNISGLILELSVFMHIFITSLTEGKMVPSLAIVMERTTNLSINFS